MILHLISPAWIDFLRDILLQSHYYGLLLFVFNNPQINVKTNSDLSAHIHYAISRHLPFGTLSL